MRILICGIMPARAYSGGRYHAWMMAEAFAALGYDVTFWTNNSPIFLDDFTGFEKHGRVVLKITEDFTDYPEGPWDQVWIIPHKHPPFHMFRSALEIAVANHAKLCLLNFETPNWVEKTAPGGADHEAWRAWRAVSPHLDLILASTQLGMRHAQDYFGSEIGARYDYCNPPINDRAADNSTRLKAGKRKSVVCITRFGSAHGHKGGREIIDYAGGALAGCRLTFIVGTAKVPQEDYDDYLAWARKHDIELVFQHRATDLEKFTLLHSADLMVFLSRFEGFGYPPVEALYCGVPCIVYDLPVLREVSGDNLVYAPLDRPEALGGIIHETLNDLDELRAKIGAADKSQLGFAAYTQNLEKIVKAEIAHEPRLKDADEASIKTAIDRLDAFDAEFEHLKAGGGRQSSLKSRVIALTVKTLSWLFTCVPPLRRIVAHAVLHPKNISAVLDDDDLSRLLFVHHKALTRRVRQNRAFLRHAMLSQEGRDLLPEVQTQIELEASVQAISHPEGGPVEFEKQNSNGAAAHES